MASSVGTDRTFLVSSDGQALTLDEPPVLPAGIQADRGSSL